MMMNPPPRWDNLLKIQPNLFESVSGFQDLQQTLSSLSLISLTKIRDPPTHPVEVEKKEWKKKKTREDPPSVADFEVGFAVRRRAGLRDLSEASGLDRLLLLSYKSFSG
jgi:hypothetical protein